MLNWQKDDKFYQNSPDMGYVHNDIKPENVMLGCSDPVGES